MLQRLQVNTISAYSSLSAASILSSLSQHSSIAINMQLQNIKYVSISPRHVWHMWPCIMTTALSITYAKSCISPNPSFLKSLDLIDDA